MSRVPVRLGLVGFAEVGFNIAPGLAVKGLRGIVALGEALAAIAAGLAARQ